MSKLSISRAWDESRGVISRDGKYLTAIALALTMLPQVVVGVLSPSGGFGFVALIAALIGVVGQLAIIRVALGPTTTVGAAIRDAAGRFMPVILAYLLLIVGMVVLFVPIMVVAGLLGMPIPEPGQRPIGSLLGLFSLVMLVIFALSVRFTMVAPVGTAETIGPVAILKRSWALTGSHYWRLLAFAILLLILIIVLMASAGAIGAVFGALVSGGAIEPMTLGALVLSLVVGAAQAIFTIISAVMLARIYLQLSDSGATASVPSSAG